jgi:hypothetical protein
MIIPCYLGLANFCHDSMPSLADIGKNNIEMEEDRSLHCFEFENKWKQSLSGRHNGAKSKEKLMGRSKRTIRKHALEC